MGEFPFEKSLEYFDTTESVSISKRQISQLRACDWLGQTFNLVLLGPPGVGKKTHLAIVLGLEAINQGKQVALVSMGELITLLKTEEYLRKSALRLRRIKTSQFSCD